MKTKIAAGFIRKNSVVESVLVTAENMKDVAKWCGGHVGVTDGSGPVEWFVHVPVVKHSYDNKPKRAFVGSYVLLDDDGFKIYRQPDFERMYEPVTVESVEQFIHDIHGVV